MMFGPKSNINQPRRKILQFLGAGFAAGIVGFFSDVAAAVLPRKRIQQGHLKKTVGVHDNWYFFSDAKGKPLVLTGSHTWGRRQEKKVWVSDGWDVVKFTKYLDFLQYWNHNYIRLWMWEQEGSINLWTKNDAGKFDLTQLNPAFFDRTRAFVEAARARGIYLGVMLFQGWSGTCEASAPDWPRHPMYPGNNVNGVDGAETGVPYGNRVHSLHDPQIVSFQEAYVRKMIDTLNGFDNILWEIGNETIAGSIPWMAHMVKFVKEYETLKPRQHLILTGTGNGVGNDSIVRTGADAFSPCVVTRWGDRDDPYIGNPPIPDASLRRPIVLDNDHLGNHFLRYTALDQRNWTWKAFVRGNHPIHMDCYDVFWDGESPTPNHPIPGVSTHPHYDPQRKSLGDVLRFANRMDLSRTKPVSDPAICSTTFCLVNAGRQYLAYQPHADGEISLALPPGQYQFEIFDTINSETQKSDFHWSGGTRTFHKPNSVSEDWVLFAEIVS